MDGSLAFGIVLASLAILTGCWLGWQLLRQNGRILLRLDALEQRLEELGFGGDDEPKGLPVGSEAPAFELADLAGERKSLGQYRGQPLLLLFFNPACGFCRELIPKLAMHLSEGQALRVPDNLTVQADQGLVEPGPPGDGIDRKPRLLIITTGDGEKNRQLFVEHKVSCPVLLQKDSEVATAYRALGTPSGYLMSPHGEIASSLAMGTEALLALVTANAEGRVPKSEEDQSPLTSAAPEGNGRANRFGNRSLAYSKIKRDGLKAGTPAPDFRLPRLDGKVDLSLSELRGKRVLLVFSSPHCGPCNALAPELEKFHRDHPGLEVLMISKGEPEENRAKVKEHGLTFPVVLQQNWEISRLYAMFATPIAYLIDEEGVIISDVAVGAEAILALLADVGADVRSE